MDTINSANFQICEMSAWSFLDVVRLSIDIFTMWMRLHAVQECQWLNGILPCSVLVIPRLRVRMGALWTSWTWHSVIATHLRNTTLNSTWNSSANQHSGSFVSKNWTAKTQYGIKGNFFINHFSIIINSFIFIFLPVVFLTSNVSFPQNCKDFSGICF